MIDDATKEKVTLFFLSPKTSREVPNKKDVIKINGEKTNKHIMTMTMSEAFDEFKKQYPDVKIGFTSFKKFKPHQVRRVSETSHKSCLCQICCNLSLKIDAIQKFSTEKGSDNLKGTVKNWNKTNVSNITLCNYSEKEYPKAECLNRSCNKCKVTNISDLLKDDVEGQMNEVITWFRWQLVSLETESGVKKVTSCVKQETSLKLFIQEMENDLIKYPGHIFRATWQHCQMQSSIDSLKPGEIVMLMDFSENYRCRFQNESQNAYFDQRQVTIHPFMLYYKDDIKLVKHSITVISDDTKHDSQAVQIFETNAIELLKEQNVRIDSIHKFSDGAAAQYKGKNSFLHVSNSKIPVVRNYFETSHGKSPCDGLGAVIKNTCWNAVKSGKTVIGSANDVFSYCKKLEHGTKIVGKGDQEYISKRNVIYVDLKDIKRETIAVKTLVGTRTLHSIRSTGKSQEVEISNLSCYCIHCKDGDGPCQNRCHVDQWTLKKLTLTEAQPQAQAEAPINNDDTSTNTTSAMEPCFQHETPPPLPVNRHSVRARNDIDTSSEESGLGIGQYVKAKIWSKRGKKFVQFVACIQSISDNTVDLSFLKMTQADGKEMYYFPDLPDESTENRDVIVKTLKEPEIKHIRRKILFDFN